MAGLKIVIDANAAERASKQLRKELGTLGSAAVDNEQDFAKLEKRLEKGMKADKAEKTLDSLKKTIGLTRLETAKLQSQIGDYSGALKTMTSGLGDASKKLLLFGAAGSAVAAGGLAIFGKSIIDTAAAFEKYEIQLKTITGSSVKAKEAMSWITEFTAKTPYELSQVTEAFVKLKAYGMDATEWMGTLGDTSAAMGKDLMQSVEMFADAATGEFERLKEFGVKASKQGDKVTFKWSQNGKDMTKTAKATQSGITDALGEIFTRFDGSMDDLSKGWEGMMSNMSDIWTQFQKEIADGGPFQALKDGLKEFLDYLKTNEGQMNLKAWANDTAKVILQSFKVMSFGASEFFKVIKGGEAVIKSLEAGFDSLKVKVLEQELASATEIYERWKKVQESAIVPVKNLKELEAEHAEVIAEIAQRLEEAKGELKESTGSADEAAAAYFRINNTFKSLEESLNSFIEADPAKPFEEIKDGADDATESMKEMIVIAKKVDEVFDRYFYSDGYNVPSHIGKSYPVDPAVMDELGGCRGLSRWASCMSRTGGSRPSN